MEVKTLLRELACVFGKDIYEDYDIDWEVWISIFYVDLSSNFDLNCYSHIDYYAEKTCQFLLLVIDEDCGKLLWRINENRRVSLYALFLKKYSINNWGDLLFLKNKNDAKFYLNYNLGV